MIPDYDNDRNSKRRFYELFNGLGEYQIKQLFPDTNPSDIQELKFLIEKKVRELKKIDISSIGDPIDTFEQDIADYINELRVQYGEIGLKKTYDKIIKIYSMLESDNKRTDDFNIVKKIKEEYVVNKKLLSSTMLYLNKIYKELNGTKDEEQIEKERQMQQMQNQNNKPQTPSGRAIW